MEKSYLNEFKDISWLYYEYCNKLADYLKNTSSTLVAPTEKLKKSIFKNNNLKTTITDYEVGTEISVIYAHINNIRNILEITDDKDALYRIIYDFTYFLKIAEKCFFYPNDDSCRVWSQVDDDKQLYVLNIETDDYYISYTFQNSVITVPGKSKNSLLSFMDDEEDDKFNTIVFTTIDIINNNQNHMKNQFKFVIGSIIEMEDDTDEMLYNVITSNTAKIIIDTLFDILNNRVKTQSRLEENLNVEDLISNGALDIWRR